MADKYAMVRKEVQRTRTESKSDYDPMKRLGLMASTAGAADTTELEDVKTRRAAAEKAADKFGALAFNYVSPDGKREERYAARWLSLIATSNLALLICALAESAMRKQAAKSNVWA
jgi:hypothetical protein